MPTIRILSKRLLEAVKAGFDSVVFDLSTLPLEKNALSTKQAVEALKSVNPSVLVEGEIGDIGSGSEIHADGPSTDRALTTPEEARQFITETKVDVLAPAVGNSHGMRKSMVTGTERKHLAIERIREIKSAACIPLTLHGGSGTAHRSETGDPRRDQYHSHQYGIASGVEKWT